ncbi:MAG: TniB family NTP-binding protein [Telluria sp.]|nr:TniB family NTP-binding protein [Telluria sp.]
MIQNDLFDRVALLDKVVVRHPALEAARLGIEECVAKTRAFREPVGSLLLAQGGMGKTTVCRMLLASMPPRVKHERRVEKTLVPAFYAAIPSPATVKSVAASLLTNLNDPSPLAGTTAHMTVRLCRLINACETKLIFLDEFHHLFDIKKTSTSVNLSVCNWLKSIVNATKVSFCLVGLPDFAPILANDSQLTRRFPIHFALRALRPGDNQHIGALIPFLASVRQQAMHRLELSAMPRLDGLFAANQMFAATGGIPAFVMALIKQSLLVALRQDRNSVTMEDIADAWDSGISAQASLTSSNPFRMHEGELAAFVRRAA